MAGTLTISTLSDGTNSTSATNCIQGSAKAWVSFVGTTGSIRGSFNVSSVTRNGAGQYIVNLTNALADTNGSIACSASDGANFSNVAFFNQEMNGIFNTTSQLYCGVIDMGNTYQDVAVCCVTVFR